MKPLGLTCVIFKELVPNDEVMPSVLLQHLLSHLTYLIQGHCGTIVQVKICNTVFMQILTAFDLSCADINSRSM